MQMKWWMSGGALALVAVLVVLWRPQPVPVVEAATGAPASEAGANEVTTAPPSSADSAARTAQAQAATPPAPVGEPTVSAPSGTATGAAATDLAQLRARLAQRIPSLAAVDEISPTPMPGLYEVRIGSDVVYTDAQGDFLIQGQLIDTRERRNLTQERVERLSAIDFASLPLEDAIVMINGQGERKMVVFSDPNCGFCKRFERDLVMMDNVTVYTFLYPILSPDSHEKARNVWCASDRLKTWQDWMLEGQVPPAVDACNNPVERLVALGRSLRVNGTPTTVFENGVRVPGAMNAQQLEQQLVSNSTR